MGFFSDLGSMVNEIKQVADEVTTTVNDTKADVTQTAQQLAEEAANAKNEFTSIGDGLKSTAQEQLDAAKNSFGINKQ